MCCGSTRRYFSTSRPAKCGNVDSKKNSYGCTGAPVISDKYKVLRKFPSSPTYCSAWKWLRKKWLTESTFRRLKASTAKFVPSIIWEGWVFDSEVWFETLSVPLAIDPPSCLDRFRAEADSFEFCSGTDCGLFNLWRSIGRVRILLFPNRIGTSKLLSSLNRGGGVVAAREKSSQNL